MLKNVYGKNNYNNLRTCSDALHRVLRGGGLVPRLKSGEKHPLLTNRCSASEQNYQEVICYLFNILRLFPQMRGL